MVDPFDTDNEEAEEEWGEGQHDAAESDDDDAGSAEETWGASDSGEDSEEDDLCSASSLSGFEDGQLSVWEAEEVVDHAGKRPPPTGPPTRRTSRVRAIGSAPSRRKGQRHQAATAGPTKKKTKRRRLRPKSAFARSTPVRPRIPLACRPIPAHKKLKRPSTTSSSSRRRYIGAGRIDVLLPRSMSATRSRKKNARPSLTGIGCTPKWMLQPPFDRMEHVRRGGGGALHAATPPTNPGQFCPPTKMGRYRCIPSKGLMKKARLMRHQDAIDRANLNKARWRRRENRNHSVKFVKVPGQSAAGSRLLRMSSLLSPLNSKIEQ